jgi:tetratricopeptide (TPR) repeat protein
MHTDDYQYRLNQHHRDEVMRAARRQHLAQLALARRPKTKRAYAAALLALWHSLFRSSRPSTTTSMSATSKWIVGLLVLVLLLTVFSARAQDMRDPGITEPYHPSFVHYRVGIYFALRGNHERALNEFTRTIDGLPSFGSAYAARGDVYLSLGEYDLAIADYTNAITIYPDFVSALYTRGRAYHGIGELHLAHADYANAMEQLPEYAMPYWGLGDLYFEREQYDEALENYQMYLALVIDEPDVEVVARIEELEIIAAAETL